MRKIALPWTITNGMWSAKTRVRYRFRPEAGRFVLSHNLSGRVWNALRDDACASRPRRVRRRITTL